MTNPLHMTSFRMLGFIPPLPHPVYNEVPKFIHTVVLRQVQSLLQSELCT